MRILMPIFSPAAPTWGGLTRVVALVDAARAAGHTIAICAAHRQQIALQQRGVPVFPMPPARVLGLPQPLAARFESMQGQRSIPPQASRIATNFWFVLTITGYAHRPYLRHLLAAELDAAREFQPDLIMTDADPSAFILAHLLDLPIACSFQTPLYTGVDTFFYRRLQTIANRILAQYGRRPVKLLDLIDSPRTLKLVPSIPELEDLDPAGPNTHFTGHLLGPIDPSAAAAFTPEPDRRYVFAYMGSGVIAWDIIQSVLPQVFPRDSRLHCIAAVPDLPATYTDGAVQFRPFVNANDLLPHCDWTLSHGGQNTIMQSLQHGVPLLICPGFIFERRYNAQKVAAQGAGLLIEPAQFNPIDLPRLLARQPEFAPGAARLRTRIAQFGGAESAITALEAWLARIA